LGQLGAAAAAHQQPGAVEPRVARRPQVGLRGRAALRRSQGAPARALGQQVPADRARAGQLLGHDRYLLLCSAAASASASARAAMARAVAPWTVSANSGLPSSSRSAASTASPQLGMTWPQAAPMAPEGPSVHIWTTR